MGRRGKVRKRVKTREPQEFWDIQGRGIAHHVGLACALQGMGADPPGSIIYPGFRPVGIEQRLTFVVFVLFELVELWLQAFLEELVEAIRGPKQFGDRPRKHGANDRFGLQADD